MRVPLRQHRGTTAHTCTLYPLSLQPSLGGYGAFVGKDVLAGGSGYFFDPFTAYERGWVTNPNVFLAGEPGCRKSTLVKTLLYRMHAVYGSTRYFAVLDPKNEYTQLAEAIGMKVVRLAPGGSSRINPLGDGGGPDEGRVLRQTASVTALLETCAASTSGERLSSTDRAAISAAVKVTSTVAGATLGDLVRLWRAPTAELVSASQMAPERLAEAGQRVSDIAAALLGGVLAGMFDGASTERLSFDDPGVVVDLSAVQSDPAALPLVMLATTAWLSELRVGAAKQWIQVMDEVWALLAHESSARWLQASYKLGRTFGVANWLITHRLSDMGAQADAGSAASEIGKGLLADTATRILMRQNPIEAELAGDRFGLNAAERAALKTLKPGRALWKVGDNTALVDHLMHVREMPLVDTDQFMRAS